MPAADRHKWDDRYRRGGQPSFEIEPWLLAQEPLLPTKGCAIDIAGGTGRHALWLAQRGMSVTLADVSPEGVKIATSEARRRQVDLATCVLDLEEQAFPAGPWHLIMQICYLQRNLLPVFSRHLAPGGLLVIGQPTRLNLQRHAKPPRQFLLEPGELPRLVGDLKILHYQEGWCESGRHEAHLVAQRL